jgi:hypothetical protein
MRIPGARTFALAAALALVGAASARADRWKPADVQLALQVADAHWPASPCFGEHQTTWLRGADLDTLFTTRNGSAPATLATS